MERKLKKWNRPVIFTVGGALPGLAYYTFAGCSTGICTITSNSVYSNNLFGSGWLADFRYAWKGV